MKIFNIVLVAAFTLISTGAFAQKNNSTSKKEQMKMQEVKMKKTSGKISNNVAANNWSAKEQMKSDLMKPASTEQSHELVVGDLGNCPNLLSRSDLSLKEQMKLKMMNQNKCMAVGDTIAVKNGKCKMCGKKTSNIKK